MPGWDMSVSADSLWLDTEGSFILGKDALHTELLVLEGFCNAAHLV